MKQGFTLLEVLCAFLICFGFAMGVTMLVSSCSSVPLPDPKDHTIEELRKELADANAKLQAERTPQVEMLDQMTSLKALHKREVAELQQRIVRQAKLMEEMKVQPYLMGLQTKLEDIDLRFEKLDERLRSMQEDIDSKARRGHTHL